MALIDSRESTKRFKEKLNNGFYKKNHLRNSDIDYTKEKQDRDTKAVRDFANSEAFNELLKVYIG